MKYILFFLVILISCETYSQRNIKYLVIPDSVKFWPYDYPADTTVWLMTPETYKKIRIKYYIGIGDSGGDTLAWPFNDSVTGIKSIRFDPCGSKDSTPIHQEVFYSFGKYHLVTTNGSSYDNVVHGDSAFIEGQKIIEFNKALARRKLVAIIQADCEH